MKNRELILIAVTAFALAGAAAYFRSPERAALPKSPVVASESVLPKENLPFAPQPKAIDVPGDPTEKALSQLRDLFAEDPADEHGRAASLLNEVCRAGEFQTALKLVDATAPEMQNDWQQIVFNRWAQRQPQDAMKAVDDIADPAQRELAFHAAVTGWNAADPAGLTDYAMSLSSIDDRSYALSAALDNWSLQDPAALATWLNTLPRGTEFDYGAAMMISKTDGANCAPEVAMRWVENIDDPDLKQNSFRHILTQWLQSDAAAAQQYVATAAWLDNSSRSKILANLPSGH